jgi:3-hydroxymyristoyl/3-hydroxydecanoyl-(acyl carrier protein) dehydratase
MRFHFVDRILPLESSKLVRGIKNVSFDGDFLEEIFPEIPVYSPVIASEAVAQLVSWLIIKVSDFTVRPVITMLDAYTCHRHIQPGDHLELEGEIENLHPESALVNGRIMLRGLPVIDLKHAVCYLYPLHKLEDVENVRRHFTQLYHEVDMKPSTSAAPTSRDLREKIPVSKSIWVDKILEFEEGKRIAGIKNVTSTEDYFNDHFPLKPIFPSVLIMESLVSLARILIGRILSSDDLSQSKPLLIAGQKIEFHKFVQPGDQLQLDARLIEYNVDKSRVQAKASVANKIVSGLSMEFVHLSRDEYIKSYLPS